MPQLSKNVEDQATSNKRAVFWDSAGRSSQPDNFVDPKNFLSLLVLNPNSTSLSYVTLMLHSVVIIQQLTIVLCMFLLSFDVAVAVAFLNEQKPVVSAGLISVLSAFFWYQSLFRNRTRQLGFSRKKLLYEATQGIICLLVLMVFTPILRTLTATYSTDTVYALVFFCATIHLYSFDYKYANIVSTRLDCSLSLNSAFLMGLLLASRMEDSFQAFIYLLLCVGLVLLIPHFLHTLRADSLIVSTLLNILALVIIDIRLFRFASSLFYWHIASVCFIVFVCPFGLKKIQKYKRVIRGPWDIVQLEDIPMD
mmetsp:Transcript_6235/g.8173  ORF Transcript_6235/g.8173 Transcript_6235/m.8173 type:complete len:309 (-) Transcript_6235:156-1082(-)